MEAYDALGHVQTAGTSGLFRSAAMAGVCACCACCRRPAAPWRRASQTCSASWRRLSRAWLWRARSGQTLWQAPRLCRRASLVCLHCIIFHLACPALLYWGLCRIIWFLCSASAVPVPLPQAGHLSELQAAREQHRAQLNEAQRLGEQLAAAGWHSRVAAAEQATAELQQRVRQLESSLADARAGIPWTPKAAEVRLHFFLCVGSG